MPSKNDLSGLKSSTPKILPETQVKEPEPIRPRFSKQIGRPKKKAEEKRNYKITISLTQAEGKIVAEKAGLAGEATYLYAMLKDAGILD